MDLMLPEEAAGGLEDGALTLVPEANRLVPANPTAMGAGT